MAPPLPPMSYMTSAYFFNDTNGTISSSGASITTTTQVQVFLGNIVKGHSAQTLKVFSTGESTAGGNTPKSTTDTLINNDVLEVTAENGAVKKYIITVL